jgi:hypothetical protein
MIKGMHGLLYTPQYEEVRAFLHDKLQLPSTDTGGGWLIFDVPAADLGVHPADHPFHSISFYCDDIFKTVKDLKGRGVEFTSNISEQSWGWITRFKMPGDVEIELYEPKYQKRGQNGKAPNTKRKAKNQKAKRQGKK